MTGSCWRAWRLCSANERPLHETKGNHTASPHGAGVGDGPRAAGLCSNVRPGRAFHPRKEQPVTEASPTPPGSTIASLEVIPILTPATIDADDCDGASDTVVVRLTDEAGRTGIGEADAPSTWCARSSSSPISTSGAATSATSSSAAIRSRSRRSGRAVRRHPLPRPPRTRHPRPLRGRHRAPRPRRQAARHARSTSCSAARAGRRSRPTRRSSPGCRRAARWPSCMDEIGAPVRDARSQPASAP